MGNFAPISRLMDGRSSHDFCYVVQNRDSMVHIRHGQHCPREPRRQLHCFINFGQTTRKRSLRTMALNPHQKNKVDISVRCLFMHTNTLILSELGLIALRVQKLSEEEQKLFRLYGKLPNKKDLLQNKLKERKYFDSGDYAMSKAGKSDAGLGREHPSYVNVLPVLVCDSL